MQAEVRMVTLARVRSITFLSLLVAACGPSVDGPGGSGPDAAGPAGDHDSDGYSSDVDCNDNNANIHPGLIDVCNGLDDDCSGHTDDLYDADFDGHSSCMGDCDDLDANTYAGAPELLDGIDNDCDGINDNHRNDYDDDGDGYDELEGDCDDDEPLVNPGAVEVQTLEDGTAEGVDNDCDGIVDELPETCDSGLPSGEVMSFVKATELCHWVTAASFNSDADARARAIVPDYGTYLPHAGASMLVLSSGIAADEDDSGYVAPQSGTAFSNTAAHPDPKPDPADGCGSADPSTVNDYVELVLEIDVPSNAKSFSYDFNFMSAEYPEWVCSEFDDTFIAYLESDSFTGNISFDAHDRPVTINIGFFTVCEVGSGSAGCTGAGPLAGTGYESAVGGGTGWLTTTAPVTPGEHVRLRFIIFDEGDHILDSAVLIDNFRWLAEPVDAPITVG
jgi:hypothetical protein